MAPRLYLPLPLRSGDLLELPPGPSRHVQVLRLQPGAPLALFNGDGPEWPAEVVQMGRQAVTVRLGEPSHPQRELGVSVTLALGMPANDRMDAVVEKAGELGAFCIQPLVCERSVLRLAGERAAKKQAHWQAVAAAASEQCGRTRLTIIAPVLPLREWLATLPTADGREARQLLSLRASGAWDCPSRENASALLFLSGPEGGLTEEEEDFAVQRGFSAALLGPRTLRADTAPISVLASVALRDAARQPPPPPQGD
jgi:16S rRNA (uracil1498-N3)-methyltransferase